MRAGPAKNKSVAYGRRLRGGAKAGRSGAVPRKRRRRSWGSEHGVEWLRAQHLEAAGRAAPQRRFRWLRGKTYGPFKAPGA